MSIATTSTDLTSGREQHSADFSISRSSLIRWAFAVIGVLFVSVGAIGVFLPGIPTTGPLLAASFFLTKSCPALERRLVRNRWFANYLHYLDGTYRMTDRMRIAAILSMWVSIIVSSLILSQGLAAAKWSTFVLLASGIVGTVVIARFRR